jgi:hypothetical protein
MLWNNAHLGKNRHEIDITIPSRHNVKMDMRFHACPCHRSKIKTNVEAVWTHGFAKHTDGTSNYLDQVEQFSIVQAV